MGLAFFIGFMVGGFFYTAVLILWAIVAAGKDDRKDDNDE